ncbi:MAG: hypothetical protein RLY42_714, partial [Pseudomonadota bacterium]
LNDFLKKAEGWCAEHDLMAYGLFIRTWKISLLCSAPENNSDSD